MVSGSFSLLQITDLHLLAAANSRLLGVDTAASLDAVLHAALSERAADAMIVTGDIAHDAAEATYARVRDVDCGALSAGRSYGCRVTTMWPRRSIGSAPRQPSCRSESGRSSRSIHTSTAPKAETSVRRNSTGCVKCWRTRRRGS